jgi:hypothetical protein
MNIDAWSPPAVQHPAFPTASIDFGLPAPRRSYRSVRATLRPTIATSSSPGPPQSRTTLSALHAAAFGDLRESIAAGDESLVQRMRAFEAMHTPIKPIDRYRSVASPGEFCGTERTALPSWKLPLDSDADCAMDPYEDPEDDVEIFTGETLDFGSVPPVGASERATYSSAMSAAYRSCSPSSNVPPLVFPNAHTSPTSPSSSPVSVHGDIGPRPAQFDEDNAIVAISLSLSNGAAGLNDYASIREAAGETAQVNDAAQVGEMWH